MSIRVMEKDTSKVTINEVPIQEKEIVQLKDTIFRQKISKTIDKLFIQPK